MDLGADFAAGLDGMQARVDADKQPPEKCEDKKYEEACYSCHCRSILCHDNTMYISVDPAPPLQSKQTLNKFCDSLLSKKNKINGLIRDLDENYGCDKASKRLCLQFYERNHGSIPTSLVCLDPRSRENREEHLAEIDCQHETLNELRTNGDVYGWNDQFRSRIKQVVLCTNLQFCLFYAYFKAHEGCRVQDEGGDFEVLWRQ